MRIFHKANKIPSITVPPTEPDVLVKLYYTLNGYILFNILHSFPFLVRTLMCTCRPTLLSSFHKRMNHFSSHTEEPAGGVFLLLLV